MVNLVWYELYPPSDLALADVTAVLRPLAHRRRQGVAHLTPLVVFELWLSKGTARWFIGIERSVAFTVPHQLHAQMNGLEFLRCAAPARPMPTTAVSLKLHGVSYPLRTDMASSVALALMQLAETLRSEQTAVVQWMVGPSAPRRVPPREFHLSEALGLRLPVDADLSTRQAWAIKAREPLFAVRGRLGAVAGSTRTANGIIRQLFEALSLANGNRAQLVASRPTIAAAKRLPAVNGSRRRWSGIANAAELGVLLGWPVDGADVPGSIGPAFRPAPAAALSSINAQTSRARLLGESLHPVDSGRLVAMRPECSLHHVHLVGPTGSGKSTALAQLVLADAAAGRSALVIEPKGDLVNDILARLPAKRHDDLVLIEPDEQAPIVGINPLAGPTAGAERRADELLDLFRTLFGTAVGPRSSDVLLHALITAARLSDGTLTDVPTLLSSPSFRRHALAQVNDQLVLAPFWAWFDNLSEPERGQVVAPVMNKLRVFTTRAALRRMLGQAVSCFDLEELFARPRIVLVNLNRGLLGPGTTKLLGSLLLTQLWQVIQRRAACPASRRQPVMVVVDEWQDYTGALDFGDVLAQARGLGVGFTLAHQHLQQLTPGLQAAVLANARSRLVFRPAQKDAKPLAAALGGGVTPEQLERLGPFQAAVRLHLDGAPSQPFAVQTLPLNNPTHDPGQLRRACLARYGVDGAAVDAALTERWQGSDPGTVGPVGVARRRAR